LGSIGIKKNQNSRNTNAPRINRNDPKTWEDESWPQAIASVGILGYNVAEGKYAWKNRQNPLIYKVFSTLMGRKNLWSSVDRHGMMRPTKNVPNFALPPQKARSSAIPPEGWENDDSSQKTRRLEDHDGWRSAENWVHWDLNPWFWTGTKEGADYVFDHFITENNGSRNTGDLKLQGLVTFSDSREEDGGFATVPGFHKYLKKWSELTQNTDLWEKNRDTYDYVKTPKDDPMVKQLQKVSSRPGSLIIWRSEQPHCNYPNKSNKFRINQYLKMFPAQYGAPGVKHRQAAMTEMLKGIEVTELGMKLFGQTEWDC